MYVCTVEPLYNRQVGAWGFVRYSEVSFIEKFHHNNVYLTPCMIKDCYTSKMKPDTCKTWHWMSFQGIANNRLAEIQPVGTWHFQTISVLSSSWTLISSHLDGHCCSFHMHYATPCPSITAPVQAQHYATPFDHAPCPLSEAYCNVLVSVCASLLVRYPELRGVRYSGVQTILLVIIRRSASAKAICPLDGGVCYLECPL